MKLHHIFIGLIILIVSNPIHAEIPTLISPISNSNITTTTVILYWNTIPSHQYYLQIATDWQFNHCIYDDYTDDNHLITGLNNNKKIYYWHVKSFDGTDWSNYSEVWSFIDGYSSNLKRPDLISPVNGENVVGDTISFTWSEPNDTDLYNIQIATDWAFENIIFDNDANSNSLDVGGIENGKQYYWRVKAHFPYVWSDYCPYNVFLKTKSLLDTKGRNLGYMTNDSPATSQHSVYYWIYADDVLLDGFPVNDPNSYIKVVDDNHLFPVLNKYPDHGTLACIDGIGYGGFAFAGPDEFVDGFLNGERVHFYYISPEKCQIYYARIPGGPVIYDYGIGSTQQIAQMQLESLNYNPGQMLLSQQAVSSGNLTVNFSHFAKLATYWMVPGMLFDMDGDEVTSIFELDSFAQYWLDTVDPDRPNKEN